MSFLLLFSFLAGFATILAPCIWPLLPLVLSASSSGGRRKPFGLTLGVMSSFTLFTLFISYLESVLHINPNAFRLLAVLVLALLGISLLFPSLGARFEILVGRLVNPLGRLQGTPGPGERRGTGFGAGYVAGFFMGILWTPCAGPILAAVATLAATRAVTLQVFMVTLAYVLGMGIPLFLVSLGGNVVFAKMRKFSKYTGMAQRVFGVVMILVAVMIYTNYDKTLQLKVLAAFPGYGHLLDGVENNQTVSTQLDSLRGVSATAAGPIGADGLADLGPAPDFAGIHAWLNSPPLHMADLRGKVVLVDFWTYSCINCLRTLPYTKAWYKNYGPDHFVLIGVHSPEFAFEQDTSNVQNALKEFNIAYPVAQDNGFQTWNAYHNRYWPAEYLIDANGRIRKADFGEGGYDAMDAAIQRLLAEAGHPAASGVDVAATREGDDDDETPESYLGLARLDRFASNEKAVAGLRTYSFPRSLGRDQIAYQGPWTLSEQTAKPGKGSALELQFSADKVYLVVGPGRRGDEIGLSLDGGPVAAAAGADVKGSKALLDTVRLYNLIDLKGKPASHRLRLKFLDPGTAVYAFTFG
jgi:cytochrome c biogenesis protein CcdA/thiol-disulfide isomerase/thioredoxin